MSNINGGSFAFAPLHAGVHRKAVQLGKVANSETATLLAGGNRLLYEQGTGFAGASAAHPGEPLVPPNPQGELGADKSGAPYGLAHMCPIWSRGGWYTDANSANWRNWWGRYDSIDSNLTVLYDFDAWVKPFPPVRNTPFSRGYLSYRIDVGASTTIFTFKLFANGQQMGKHTTSGLSAGDRNGEITDVWFLLQPGWNSFRIEITSDSATASEIYGLAVNQTKEYSHDAGLF